MLRENHPPFHSPLACAYAHPLFSCLYHLARTPFVFNHWPLACCHPTSAQFCLAGASPFGASCCRQAGVLILDMVVVLDIGGDAWRLQIGTGGLLCARIVVCVVTEGECCHWADCWSAMGCQMLWCCRKCPGPRKKSYHC